jgi:hypothetical protein
MTESNNGGTPVGATETAVEVAVSQRARTAVKSFACAESAALSAPTRSGPSEGLLASLRHHLLAGETHYPDRPGMGELRRRVGEALPAVGFLAREPDGVLITQGEGESLFATILGLGGGEGAAIVGKAGGRHQRLLDWMRVRVIEPGTDAAGAKEAAFHLIEYEAGAAIPVNGNASDTSPLPQVHAIGDRLFAGGNRPGASESPIAEGVLSSFGSARAGSSASGEPDPALADAIVIGSLDGLDGMQPFSLGFVAAPVAVRPRIAKWKQASSICSPAPSQRAGLWALGVRP